MPRSASAGRATWCGHWRASWLRVISPLRPISAGHCRAPVAKQGEFGSDWLHLRGHDGLNDAADNAARVRRQFLQTGRGKRFDKVTTLPR
jgi:hypothetical protein